jgi:hypothetical protein
MASKEKGAASNPGDLKGNLPLTNLHVKPALAWILLKACEWRGQAEEGVPIWSKKKSRNILAF